MGLYSEKSIVSVPQELKNRYFRKVGKGFQIADEIKRQVEFREHNLLSDLYPTGCHLIVCRNVMIYFTEEARDSINKKFSASLVRGGILFIGSAEQIINYKELKFQRKKSFFFQKE